MTAPDQPQATMMARAKAWARTIKRDVIALWIAGALLGWALGAAAKRGDRRGNKIRWVG